MKPTAIVAEGPDDLAALRALLRAAGATVKGTFHDANRNPLQVALNESTIDVYAAGGKKRELTERAIHAARGTASHRPDVVIVCFDPDGDAEPAEFSFFAKHLDDVRGTVASALATDATTGAHSFVVDDRTVAVIPAPWRLDGAPAFAGLPEEHNLERVLISGLLDVLPQDPRTTWAGKSAAELMTLVTGHGWKRAFRLWNAAVVPTSESAVDRLLQEKEVKASCLASLQKARAWQRIMKLLAADAPNEPE